MKKPDSEEPVSRGVLDEAVEAILRCMKKMFGNFRGEMDTKFVNVDERFDKLQACQKNLLRQISNLRFETQTQKEFNTLKIKVDKYHSFS